MLRQKLEELLDLDDDNLQQVLTPEEKARIAGKMLCPHLASSDSSYHYILQFYKGGFGATDESVAQLLNQALERDINDHDNKGSSSLQDLVNEGLSFALRSSDYHTSRQLLILYSLISSKRHKKEQGDSHQLLKADESGSSVSSSSNNGVGAKNNDSNTTSVELSNISEHHLKAPPPPPLDTDRLRSATNSDGLLAVLGAAQVLKAMQDGSAKRRVTEAIESIEE